MKITDRYTSAVHSSNLKSKAETTSSDTDVLGAAAWASKPVRVIDGVEVRGSPLGIALMRLFAGDNTAAHDLVQIMAGSVKGKAKRDGMALKWVQCEDIGRAVLAWHRDGVCRPCGGHGYRLIEGAPTLSGNVCPSCRGAGKVPFDDAFSLEMLLLARWLLAEVEREQAIAGPAAMAALAPRLEL